MSTELPNDADDRLLGLVGGMKTRQVRFPADLGFMLRWISEITGQSAPDILDALLRPHVTPRFEKLRPLALQVARAREAARGIDLVEAPP